MKQQEDELREQFRQHMEQKQAELERQRKELQQQQQHLAQQGLAAPEVQAAVRANPALLYQGMAPDRALAEAAAQKPDEELEDWEKDFNPE